MYAIIDTISIAYNNQESSDADHKFPKLVNEIIIIAAVFDPFWLFPTFEWQDLCPG